jgi:uncharacterized OsmC-like protein
MSPAEIAAALERAEAVIRRRPSAAITDDAQADVRWTGGLRSEAQHASGLGVVTDMPRELGGQGSSCSPGWLLRAALASCAVTRIAMGAASQGIQLALLEASASSRSDLRGLLGVPAADGRPVRAGPSGVVLQVRIAAPGVPAERLNELVQNCSDLAPVTAALQLATPVRLEVQVDGV